MFSNFSQNGFSDEACELLLDQDGLDLGKVNYLMEALAQKKQQLEGVSSDTTELYLHNEQFLHKKIFVSCTKSVLLVI